MSSRNDYIKQWRKTPAGQAYQQADKRRQKARQRAYAELAQRYDDEYEALLVKHIKAIEDEERVRAAKQRAETDV